MMKNTHIVLLFILLLNLIYAQIDDVINSTIERNEYLDKPHLTILGFTVNESSFQDIQDILGQSTIVDIGHEDIICYGSNIKNDTTKIIFYKNDIADIVGFKLCLDDSSNSTCKIIDKINSEISIEGGLKLHLSKEEIIYILGKPTYEADDYWEYYYHIQEQKNDFVWDVCSTIKITFKKSKTYSISVFKTVTN